MIKLNEKCPDFEISNQKGETFSQKHLIGKISVLFFYPKNFTPGCTKEACSFRDNYSEFKELGCQVVGISGDDPLSHQKFQEKFNLPYQTYADLKNKFRKSLVLPGNLFGLIPGRVTLIFDQKAVLKGSFVSQLNTQGHIDFALSKVKEIV